MKTNRRTQQSITENNNANEKQKNACCSQPNNRYMSRSIWNHYAETFRNLYADLQLINKSCC
ncbi:hypothetical protein [Solitalea canadensis]|uniref:Uncharacterized protein n=1 Tax=Solitalea canadensis (strain ATCC 29591 / DSM 3403 / JCM 21819 / LMG 8368 / NBRC 15130 / NCIMB 12057 / USAM 9D) TaxID=929556 RepID=H8KLD5_SOLCM|nr:hypothetical protein [Solitalea canadensis]AFD08637.1 hypothetical protein Solca_3633 [Solitalea canadensis DSM 3403]